MSEYEDDILLNTSFYENGEKVKILSAINTNLVTANSSEKREKLYLSTEQIYKNGLLVKDIYYSDPSTKNNDEPQEVFYHYTKFDEHDNWIEKYATRDYNWGWDENDGKVKTYIGKITREIIYK